MPASVTPKEKKLLRDIAKEVKNISKNPVWFEKRRLWKQKNALWRVRPLMLASLPGAAWREMLPESDLEVGDETMRRIEWDLRKRIYRWCHIGDDAIIDDKVFVPVERTLTDWMEGRVRPYSARVDRAEKFHPVLEERCDLKKLRYPELKIDREASNRNYEKIGDIFQGILDVIPGEPFYAGTDGPVMGWGNSLIDILCELRGLENIYYDLIREPRFVHDAMLFLTKGTLKYLDTLEREDLLRLNNNEFISASNTPLGSNGLAITDELPREGSTPGHVRTGDLWGYFMAQEFSEVSPDMLEEFVLPYQARVAARFGMNAYGCCEANDKKWSRILAHIPNLEIAAFDETAVRKELKKGLDITKECRVVVCLRDTQTLFGKPERAWKWTAIAQELAAEHA
jgi:hypothetical protein